jgi:hypothetical protein
MGAGSIAAAAFLEKKKPKSVGGPQQPQPNKPVGTTVKETKPSQRPPDVEQGVVPDSAAPMSAPPMPGSKPEKQVLPGAGEATSAPAPVEVKATPSGEAEAPGPGANQVPTTGPDQVPIQDDATKEAAVMKMQAKAKGDQGRKRAAEIKDTQAAALAEARAALESGDADRLALAVKTGHEVGLGKKDVEFVAACDKLASLRPGAPELSTPAPVTFKAKAGLDPNNGVSAGDEPLISTTKPEMDSKTAEVAAILMRCSEAVDMGDADTAFASFGEFNDLRTATPNIENDLAMHGWSPAIIQDLESRVNEQKSEARVEEICAGPPAFSQCCSMRDKSAY